MSIGNFPFHSNMFNFRLTWGASNKIWAKKKEEFELNRF